MTLNSRIQNDITIQRPEREVIALFRHSRAATCAFLIILHSLASRSGIDMPDVMQSYSIATLLRERIRIFMIFVIQYMQTIQFSSSLNIAYRWMNVKLRDLFTHSFYIAVMSKQRYGNSQLL